MVGCPRPGVSPSPGRAGSDGAGRAGETGGSRHAETKVLVESGRECRAVVRRRGAGDRGSPAPGICMKLSINSHRKCNGFVLLAQALPQYLCGGLSFSQRLRR